MNFNKLLNFVLPLLSRFFDHKKLEQKSNGWNQSPIAEKKTETLQVVKAEEARFYHPVGLSAARVTSPYGYRNLNIDGKSVRQFHMGVDFGGTGPVYAVEDCIVTKALAPDKEIPVRFEHINGTWVDLIKSGAIAKDRAWTPYVILKGKHTGIEYKYKHTDPSVAVGDEVIAGAQVGRSGNYGYSMGGHLHFEVWVKGKTCDPVVYLAGKELVK